VDIHITAIHSEVSDSVKAYAREKVAKLEKFFDKARKTEVHIHAERENNDVELVCFGAKNHVFTVHVTAEQSVREAIDLAVDKMATQLRRHKEKIKSHKGAENHKKLARDVKRVTQRIAAPKDGEDDE
jgi:putative sigma-54 modulation protein